MHLMEKAGCGYDPSILPAMKLQRYQTEKKTMQYAEYVSFIEAQGRHCLLDWCLCCNKLTS